MNITKKRLRDIIERAFDNGDDVCGLAKNIREAKKMRREIVTDILESAYSGNDA